MCHLAAIEMGAREISGHVYRCTSEAAICGSTVVGISV